MASLPQAPATTLYIPGFHLLADRAACCARWTSETGNIELLTSPSQLSCKIGYDRSSGAALFRLFVPIASNASTSRRNPLYVSIDPLHVSQLHSLSLDSSQATQECVRFLVSSRQCSSPADVIALQFLLKQPPTVIGHAATTSLEPLADTSRLFQSLRSLSLATNLTLYLPRNKISVECVDDLCARAQNGSLRPSPQNFCLADMYGGDGGVDINPLLRAFIGHQPPPYPDVASTSEGSTARPNARRYTLTMSSTALNTCFRTYPGRFGTSIGKAQAD